MISLLMPTRGRPSLAERFFHSVAEMSSHPEAVEVIFYVDDDDTGSHRLDSHEICVKRLIGPRLSMGEYNARCLQESRGDIVILVNDDMVIRTPGWDDKVRAMHASFPDGVYLAYGNDLFKGSKLCSFPILSRRTCELLMEPYPREYQGAFIDYHLLDIFKRLQHAGHDRIRYLADVIFEHMHYRSGKAAKDETYINRSRFADDPVFVALTYTRKQAAYRLLNTIDGRKPTDSPAVAQHGSYPKSLWSAIVNFTRQFLFDRDLAFKWRLFLWYWFIGRYMAARGLLRPFVKP